MSISTPQKVPLDTVYNMTKTEDNITSKTWKSDLKKYNRRKTSGVITEQYITFEEHLTTKTNKANQMMGLIRRSFHHLNIQIFRWLYKALVRPHMEYSQAAWSPMRKKDIITLENVQRRATKLIPCFRDMPYHERLRRIDLPTLSYRRLRGDMVEPWSRCQHQIVKTRGTHQRKSAETI